MRQGGKLRLPKTKLLWSTPIVMAIFRKVLGDTCRIIRRIACGIWEVVCWLIVPVVFGYLCYGSIAKKFDVSVLQICLAAIALSPWILRLLPRYLSEFDIGLKGVSGKTKQGTVNKDEIEGKKLVFLTEERIVGTAESAFGKLLPQPKKVVRTLWKYQVEQFGPHDIRRWGFAVGTGAHDYHDFSLGVLELMRMHLVAFDSRGFVFLTDAGVEFCEKHNAEIVKYPDYYSSFSN